MRWHKINEWTWISEIEDKIQLNIGEAAVRYTAYPMYGGQVGMPPVVRDFTSLKEAKNYVNNETGWCK